MIKRYKELLHSLISSAVLFLTVKSALAIEESQPGQLPNVSQPGQLPSGESVELKNPLGTDNIIDVINSVLNYLIYISVPILAFMILWGGFQILTARDDPEKVKNGRKTIQWASIGFAVILISKGVALILLKILKG